MGWLTDDGEHEGFVGMRFADGALGAGWQGTTVLVSHTADGRELGWDEWQHRPEREVVGWNPSCSCGWRGEGWDRAAEPWEADPGQRSAYSPDSHVPEDLEDGSLLQAWREHVEPIEALERLRQAAAEHRRTGRELDQAVARVRAAGKSWTDVGTATGMNRQSAHQRWSRDQPDT